MTNICQKIRCQRHVVIIVFTTLNLEIDNRDIKFLMKLFPKGVIFFDLETTGLSPAHSEILEFGAVKVKDNKASFFDELVKPSFPISAFITELTGITDEMVKNARRPKQVLSEFIPFLEDCTLIAHNAPFDVGHLMASCSNLDIKILDREVYCSCKLSRKCLDSPNHKLSTIIDFLKLGQPRNLHRALGDAYLVYKVIIAILKNEENIKKLPLSMIGSHFTSKKKIPQLLSAQIINDQKQIEILYRGGSHQNIFRPIKPISILPLMNGKMVLYALCLLSNLYKNFDIEKIVEVKT